MIIQCYKVYFDDITPSMQKTVNRVKILNKIMTTPEQRTKYNFAAPLISFNLKMIVPALVAGIIKKRFVYLGTSGIKCFLPLFFPKLSISTAKLIDSS